MRNLLLILTLSISCFSMSSTLAPNAQPSNTRSVYKAVYISQFASLIEWPSSLKSGSFIIGVYGDNSLYNELKTKHSSKTIGSQPIKILKFSSKSEISKCHILYVHKSKSADVSDLVKKYKSGSTLVVAESDGALSNGAVVNFVIKNNRQLYELSKSNAKKYNLVINSTLTKYATKVE